GQQPSLPTCRQPLRPKVPQSRHRTPKLPWADSSRVHPTTRPVLGCSNQRGFTPRTGKLLLPVAGALVRLVLLGARVQLEELDRVVDVAEAPLVLRGAIALHALHRAVVLRLARGLVEELLEDALGLLQHLDGLGLVTAGLRLELLRQ